MQTYATKGTKPLFARVSPWLLGGLILTTPTAACDQQDQDLPFAQDDETVETEVGEEGGAVSSPAGASVSFPAGAISGGSSVAITPVDPPTAAIGLGTAAWPVAFSLEPAGLVLDRPATVDLQVAPNDPERAWLTAAVNVTPSGVIPIGAAELDLTSGILRTQIDVLGTVSTVVPDSDQVIGLTAWEPAAQVGASVLGDMSSGNTVARPQPEELRTAAYSLDPENFQVGCLELPDDCTGTFYATESFDLVDTDLAIVFPRATGGLEFTRRGEAVGSLLIELPVRAKLEGGATTLDGHMVITPTDSSKAVLADWEGYYTPVFQITDMKVALYGTVDDSTGTRSDSTVYYTRLLASSSRLEVPYIYERSGEAPDTAAIGFRGPGIGMEYFPPPLEIRCEPINCPLALAPGAVGELRAMRDGVEQTVTWESDSTAVATIDDEGVVTGVNPGFTEILAISAIDTARMTLLVSDPDQIWIDPNNLPWVPGYGETRGIKLIGFGQQLVPADPINVETSDATVLHVALQDGGFSYRAEAVTEGTATVTVTSGNLADSATFEVAVPTDLNLPDTVHVEEGQLVHVAAQPVDSADRSVAGIVAWSWDEAALRSVWHGGNARNFRARAAGETLVTASLVGSADTTVVIMDTVRLAQVKLQLWNDSTPIQADPEPWLAPGAAVTLVPIAMSAGGGILEGREIEWSTSDTLAALVSDSGVVTGVDVGSASIVALSRVVPDTVGGDSIFADTVIVHVDSVAGVDLRPSTIVLSPQATLQMFAAALNANGQKLFAPMMAWQTSDTTVVALAGEPPPLCPTGQQALPCVLEDGTQVLEIQAVGSGSAMVTAESVAQADTAEIVVANYGGGE